jgi:hypothetical protein
VAEREASGEFDYLFDDRSDADGSIRHDQVPEPVTEDHFDSAVTDDDQWDDPDDTVWNNDARVVTDESFDAFEPSTWTFEPAPTPWYRTRPAVTALLATTAAAAAIVVSGVLLLFRIPSTSLEETTSITPTAPTNAPSRQLATSAPPAPPQPPPPPETSAAPINTAPVQTNRPRSPSRTTKDPEIGVTRTPATRSPISVAPQRPGSDR